MSTDLPPNRSREWFDTPELYGWLRRAGFKAEGFSESSYEGKPIIGICNTWSELTHCNSHLRDLAQSVKIGVWQAGGFPMEFPVMSLGEYNMKPTTMLYRNLLSMDKNNFQKMWGDKGGKKLSPLSTFISLSNLPLSFLSNYYIKPSIIINY